MCFRDEAAERVRRVVTDDAGIDYLDVAEPAFFQQLFDAMRPILVVEALTSNTLDPPMVMTLIVPGCFSTLKS